MVTLFPRPMNLFFVSRLGFYGHFSRTWIRLARPARVTLKHSHTVLIRINTKVNSRTNQIIFEMTLDQRVKCEYFQEFSRNSIFVPFVYRSGLDRVVPRVPH